MDAVTYPESRIEVYLNEEVIPYKTEIATEADLARGLSVTWTPGLVWLDAEGRMEHSNVGYFSPEELIAESLFGCAQVYRAKKDWRRAKDLLDRIVDQHPL